MNPTTYSERRGSEIYVYVLGWLVMKRWLDTGMSVTFHVAPDGARWSLPEGKAGRGLPDAR